MRVSSFAAAITCKGRGKQRATCATTTVQVPQHLASIYRVRACAFPTGIEPEAYFPLLAILYEHMSHRGIAELLELYFGRDSVYFLNDVYRVATTDILDPEAVWQVKQRLIRCGYQAWLSDNREPFLAPSQGCRAERRL